MNDIEKVNMVILLCINFLTLLKSARAIEVLTVAQRKFRHEIRTRLDRIDPPDR